MKMKGLFTIVLGLSVMGLPIVFQSTAIANPLVRHESKQSILVTQGKSSEHPLTKQKANRKIIRRSRKRESLLGMPPNQNQLKNSNAGNNPGSGPSLDRRRRIRTLMKRIRLEE